MKDVKYSMTHGTEPEIVSRYYNLAGEHYHLTGDEIVELGREFLKWTQSIKKPYRAEKFFRKLGWGYEVLKRWRDKYPEFRDLYNAGKEELGEIREMGAMERKLDSSTVNSTLHMYFQEHQDIRRAEIELKSKLATDSIKILSESKEYIVMDSFAAIEQAMKDKE